MPYKNNKHQQLKLSICLCCYNDAKYLDLLLSSIYQNTKFFPYEVVIVDNASIDNTRPILDKWQQFMSHNLLCIYLQNNMGVPAVNMAVEYSSGKYIVDMNSDMVMLPGWDKILVSELRKLEHSKTWNGLCSVSLKLIEPYPDNPEYFYFDAGRNPDEFNFPKLYQYIQTIDSSGLFAKDTIQFSHPICMSYDTWHKVGGITEGVYPFPGMCTDVDLGFKILSKGGMCVMKNYPGCYHFSSATLKRMRGNGIETPPGVKEFVRQWGVHPDEMYQKYNVRKECEICTKSL